MKRCRDCGIEKSADEFHRAGVHRGKPQLTSRCKPCRSAHRKAHEDRSGVNERRRTKYATDPEYRRFISEQNRFGRYGLTGEEVEALLLKQGGKCACCGSASSGVLDWAVDHDHSCCPGIKSCGKCVRGLLCHNCNRGLGMFKDDPDRLWGAIWYLEDWLMAGLTGGGKPNLSAGISRMLPAR